MLSKLPRWVWGGTWVLAFIAGIVNVIGLMGLGHETISHLTGNTSRLAEALALWDVQSMRHAAALLGAFVAGTVASGLIIEDNALQLDGKYGVVLLLESAMLLAAAVLLNQQRPAGMYAAACACGLQNAMVSTYSGAVVRTTHLSGMFTDLGISLGHFARGLPVNVRRVSLCFVVISGFLCGGVAGTLAFKAFGYSALLFPAGLTALTAAAYGAWRRFTKG